MLQCFAALQTKLYPEASHVGPAGQSRIDILFLASFGTKMADEESQEGKKRTKEKRVWKDSKVETLNRCPVQKRVRFLRTTPDSFSSSPLTRVYLIHTILQGYLVSISELHVFKFSAR